jgi:hypothetical protein
MLQLIRPIAQPIIAYQSDPNLMKMLVFTKAAKHEKERREIFRALPMQQTKLPFRPFPMVFTFDAPALNSSCQDISIPCH